MISAARQKPSITLDPYQRVQLDISDPSVHSIEDALAKISLAETIHYKSNSGEIIEAFKQTSFETLPKILILHLKRFDFVLNESSYATIQKINKIIGYKRQLQIPPSCIAEAHRHIPVNYQLFGGMKLLYSSLIS